MMYKVLDPHFKTNVYLSIFDSFSPLFSSCMFVLFLSDNIIIDSCNEPCSSVCRSAVSRGENVGHYTQTVKPNLFILALLIGTVDLYP